MLYYRNLVKKEAKLAGIKPCDKVLCIGGGICPYTGILLHRYTGAEVTIVDNNQACIEKSRRFLKRRGLQQIQVCHGDGTTINCSDYTVIHLALQVAPKEQVLESVVSCSQVGARVLVRMPKAGVAGLYSELTQKMFSFESCIDHSSLSNVGKTLLCVVPQKPRFGARMAT